MAVSLLFDGVRRIYLGHHGNRGHGLSRQIDDIRMGGYKPGTRVTMVLVVSLVEGQAASFFTTRPPIDGYFLSIVLNKVEQFFNLLRIYLFLGRAVAGAEPLKILGRKVSIVAVAPAHAAGLARVNLGYVLDG